MSFSVSLTAAVLLRARVERAAVGGGELPDPGRVPVRETVGGTVCEAVREAGGIVALVRFGGAVDADAGRFGGAVDADAGRFGGAVDADPGRFGGELDGEFVRSGSTTE